MLIRSRGFTIVELLIVIVVIAILASISIVAYNGVQNRAHDTAVQSDLKNYAEMFEIYHFDNSNNNYPWNGTTVGTVGAHVTKESYAVYPTVTRNFVYCTDSGYDNYALIAKSKSGNNFIIKSTPDSTVEQYSVTWNNSTTAASLCAGLGAPFNSTNQQGGYYYYGVGWESWTD